MTEASFILSAFGDEISADLSEQLATLNTLHVRYLDLRGAWGKNVLHMDDSDLAQVAALCTSQAIKIGCLGSPIGKSPITEPAAYELSNLQRMFKVGDVVGCRNIRIFSFYPPDTSTNEHYDQFVGESIGRLQALSELAAKEGFTLLLENEKGIVTDTLARSEK